MKKRFLNLCAWGVTLLMGAAMTSCVYDKDEYMEPEVGTFTINIKSDNFDVPLTRAAVNNQTDQTQEIENTITTANTVIAIFDGSGNIIDVEVPTLVDGKLTLSKTQTGTNWLENAAEIYVAANLPAATVTTLAALSTTKADFVAAASLGITDALNSNSLTGTQIPMFGYGTVSSVGANNYTATVNVEHMLTKVTLNSLGVDFSRSATPNASFQPEQVFLINVPDNIGITGGTTNAISQATPSKYYYGEAAGATADGANNNTGANHQLPNYATTYSASGDKFNAADYLGTAALADQTVMSAESPVWLKDATAGSQVRQQYFFYTMPNKTGVDDATQTKLVIRGAFKENASAAATEVYYAIPLNGISTYTLDENKNYQVDVIIKQKGAADTYAALPNDITATLSVTTNVTNFNDVPTTVTIGNGATSSASGIENTAKVGDYFYNDGTWSSEYDTKGGTRTLVGLVFSTNVSATDIAAGYTHGYVMALKDCVAPDGTTKKFKWYSTMPSAGTRTDGLFNTTIFSGFDQYTDDAPFWTALKGDMDGLSHTDAIGANFTGYDGSATDKFAGVSAADMDASNGYQAAWAAKIKFNTDNAVTGTTSGWYLPSCGQLYELAYNFGGRTAWSGLTFNHAKKNQGLFNEFHECYYADGADVTTNAINTFLTARLVTAAALTPGTDYDEFIMRTEEPAVPARYWSSSDYTAYYGLGLLFNAGNSLYIGCDIKTGQYYVRPVLAF